ncbi:MAG TPA: ubiquinol-cytochrome C chaperone family protein [Patescibacteria group bacterium]|nr:ubiquinol-cytochrome C chaperone family protein [Patescibacteria group bacterium]
MFSKLFGRGRWEAEAHALYTAVVTQARCPEFYTQCGVADSVDGRFDLLALHCFLVMHRLGEAGKPLAPLSQALFDLMFADMDQSLREMGVTDTGVSVRIKKMVTAFYGRISAYEPGLADDEILSGALARNLYRGEPVGSAELAAMVGYVKAQAALLAGQDFSELEQGRVRFGTPMTP